MTYTPLDWIALGEMALRLATAFALGAVIGLERQIRQRTAGLRTNTLVAVGAASFVALGMRVFEVVGGPQTPIHIIAYVVSGIGFLGAGAIMKEGANVSGLNTAATLWGSGAVGAGAGAGLLGEACLVALFVLAGNTLLRPVVNAINRQPFHTARGEANYLVQVICARGYGAQVREQLIELLATAHYPVRELEEQAFGSQAMQISATLYATAIQDEELARVIEDIEALDGVQQAFWYAEGEG